MTNEKAITDLKEALKEVDTFRKIYSKQRKVSVEYEKRYASLSLAIKALEQQPCEDCISRQAVDDAIYDYSRSCDVNYEQIMEFIDKLPSVTPERPKGKWIEIEIDAGEFIYKCTKCGMRVINPYKYCPNCGAEMSRGEEDG